jgi:hypothetical protein
MSRTDIATSPVIFELVRKQSSTFLQAFHADPRLASVFATRQRWLLAHAALGLYFRDGRPGERSITLSRYLEEVARYRIASRNTADAFIKWMLHYGYVETIPDPADRRARPMTVRPQTLSMVHDWAVAHLTTLDQMDGGRRLPVFLADQDAFPRLEIEIAHGVLTNHEIRKPKDTFSLFTWLNNGGLIMDWLITNLDALSPDGSQYSTRISSLTEISGWINLSRSHLGRKLREAEAMGSMGWTRTEGGATLWVSVDFMHDMVDAQAVKLAVIDAAFERSFSYRGAGRQRRSEPTVSPQ